MRVTEGITHTHHNQDDAEPQQRPHSLGHNQNRCVPDPAEQSMD
ncbi:hypothetical protein [Streptomyces sp. NPDC059080]